jgi:hypothetical protein
MMIPIKIQCECGQRYAFEVEPVNGRMASLVACPICGVDGTVAANAIIAQSGQPPAAEPVLHLRTISPALSIQPASPAPAPRRTVLNPGQLEPAKAETEARSKIFWGDPPEEVVKFLMMHGFNHADASAAVRAVFQERSTMLQGIGIRKIITGIGMMVVPVVAFLFFAFIHFMPIKLMALAVAVGLWGVWLLIRGLIMLFVPKLESGDIADK